MQIADSAPVSARTLCEDAKLENEEGAGIEIRGATVLLDPAGALVWPMHSLLAVADLHLEKGSAYAARGIFLPPWDTATVLQRLAGLIDRWRPRMVVALGDSFHDRGAGERMSRVDHDRLRSLQSGRDWIWIAGNHDPAAPSGVDGDFLEQLAIGPLTFRHEPSVQPGDALADGEIAGHLHPVARVVSRRGSTRRRCFVADDRRCVMPAFGALAGGLNICDAAYGPLFARAAPIAHVLGNTRVFGVSMSACVGD